MNYRAFSSPWLVLGLLIVLAPVCSVAREKVAYQDLSLAESAQLIRDGRVRSRDLVEALIRRVEIDGPAGSDRHLLVIGLEMEKILGPVPRPKH